MFFIIILNFFLFFSSLKASTFSDFKLLLDSYNLILEKKQSINFISEKKQSMISFSNKTNHNSNVITHFSRERQKKITSLKLQRPVLVPYGIVDHLTNGSLKLFSLFAPGSLGNGLAIAKLLHKNFLIGDIHIPYTFSNSSGISFKINESDQFFLDKISFSLYVLSCLFNPELTLFFNNNLNYYHYRLMSDVSQVSSCKNFSKSFYFNVLLPLISFKKILFYRLKSEKFSLIDKEIKLKIISCDLSAISLFNFFNRKFDLKDYVFHKIVNHLFGEKFISENNNRTFISLLFSSLTWPQISQCALASFLGLKAGKYSIKKGMQLLEFMYTKTPRVFQSKIDNAVYNFDTGQKRIFLYLNLAFLFDKNDSGMNTFKMAFLNYFIKREYELIYGENHFLSTNQIYFAKKLDLNVLKIELARNLSNLLAVYLLNPSLFFNSPFIDSLYTLKEFFESQIINENLQVDDETLSEHYKQFESRFDEVRRFLFPPLQIDYDDNTNVSNALFSDKEKQIVILSHRAIELFCLDPAFLIYYIQAANPFLSYEKRLSYLNEIFLLKNKMNL